MHHDAVKNQAEIEVEYFGKGGIAQRTMLPMPESKTVSAATFDGLSLIRVVLPDGIMEIGERAFQNRVHLESVVIPGSVEIIGTDAFRDCKKLKNVTLQEGVAAIGESAFEGCTSLTGIVIPKSVDWMSFCVFRGCTQLTDVVIEGNTIFNGTAFWDTPWYDALGEFPIVHGRLLDYRGSSENVTIPDGVREIGLQAFFDSHITHVTIPESVNYIWEGAFQGCEKLTSVTIPDGVTEIGDYAFEGCTSLRSVVIPKSVKKIDDHAFEAGTKLIRM